MKKLLLAVGFSAFTMAAYAQAVEFAVADADGDGTLSDDELKRFIHDMHKNDGHTVHENHDHH